MLDDQQRQTILTLARNSIQAFLHDQTEIGPPDIDFLKPPAGAFVTLKIRDILRGCIGFTEARSPLGETIVKCAILSATEDPRFPKLTPHELASATIEVSILSPFHEIKDIEEIEVGIHGLMFSLGQFRGLLLPQVAVEWGWDRLQFLQHVARKAGLFPHSWKDPNAKIEIFTAEVFGEH